MLWPQHANCFSFESHIAWTNLISSMGATSSLARAFARRRVVAAQHAQSLAALWRLRL
jgi:hypothetical protein